MWSELAGRSVYVDANIVIYAVEQGNPWSANLRRFFDAVDRQQIRGLTSELTLAEVMAKPIKIGALELINTYEAFLGANSTLQVVPIDRSILRSAAALRGQLGIKLLDAIHAATASHYDCELFFSNDDDLSRKVVPRIRAFGPNDLGKENSQ